MIQLSVEKPKSRATTPDIPRKCLECARRQKTDDVQKIKKDLIEEQKRISEAEVLFQLRQNQDEVRISELGIKMWKKIFRESSVYIMLCLFLNYETDAFW